MIKFKIVLLNILNDMKTYRIPLIIISVYFLLMQLLFSNVCPIKLLFGIPCPGCGLTRACYCVISLHWKDAINYNATSFFWVLAISYGLWKKYKLNKSANLKYTSLMCILLGLMTIIYYILRMCILYPNITPMDYYENNLYRYLMNYFEIYTHN